MRTVLRLPCWAIITLSSGILLHTTEGFHVQNSAYLNGNKKAPAFDIKKDMPCSSINKINVKERRSIFPLSSSSSESSSARNGDESSSSSTPKALPASKSFDFGALIRYDAAFCIQMALFAGVFSGLDALVAAVPKIAKVPFAVNFFFFYAFALKSRILNPLNNQRPQPATKELKDTGDGSSDPSPRIMPSWTPPGVVFPIVWLLIIGPLRAVSSSLVYQATGRYFCTAIMTLMAHLSIGDIWNTINNKERRYGTSVVGVLMVWASAAFAAYQYSLVAPLAGKLLALPLVWLTVASSLIVRTWQLNPAADTGKPESLLPVKNAGETTITKLQWFES